jgi:hypothetical protein
MNESRLQTALAVVPVVSAGLYLLGFAYHQGYLDGFGIEDSLFPLAADRSLLFGFFAFVSFGLVPMTYALAAFVFLFFTVVVAAVISSAPRVKEIQTRIITKLRSWLHKREPSPSMSFWVDKSGAVYGYAAGGFLVLFLLTVVALLAAKSGKEQAQKEIAAFAEQKGNWVVVHSPLLPEPKRAKQITCSDIYCAFWLGSEALIFRHENIERIVTFNPAVQRTLREKASRSTPDHER